MADKEKEQKKKFSVSDFFKNMSKRERIVFYLCAFFAMLFLLDRMILLPIVNKLKMLKENIELKKIVIQDGLMIIGYKDNIEQEYNDYKDYLSDEIKSQEEEIAGLLKDLENIAAKSNVYIISISPSDEIETTNLFTRYKVQLDCKGEATSIVSFIHAIGSLKDLMKIEGFDVSPAGKDSSELKLTMSVSKVAMGT